MVVDTTGVVSDRYFTALSRALLPHKLSHYLAYTQLSINLMVDFSSQRCYNVLLTALSVLTVSLRVANCDSFLFNPAFHGLCERSNERDRLEIASECA
jgi:hypothetical protein